MLLEKTLESPLNCKEIQPANHQGHQPWIFIGRTDAAAEIQYFGYLMGRTDSFEKTLMLGTIEVGWRRGWQGSLACCSAWGCKELYMSEWLNWMQGNFWNLKKGKWWISFFPTFSASFKHVYIHNDYLNVNLCLSLFLAIFLEYGLTYGKCSKMSNKWMNTNWISKSPGTRY